MGEYFDKSHLIAPTIMKLLEFNKRVMNWLEISLLVAANSPKRTYDVFVEFLAIDKMLTELEDKQETFSMDEVANRIIRKDMVTTIKNRIYEEEMNMSNTVVEENSDTKKKKKAPKQDPNKQKKDVKNPPKKKK